MKKILIIKNKRIGDVLVASIVANNLKKIFADSHISFLCYDYTSPVLKNNPNIDTVLITSNQELKKIEQLFKLGQQIKNEEFDIVIDLYAKFQSQFLCLMSRADIRLSFDKKGLPFSYTHKLPILKKGTSNYGKAIDDRLRIVNFFDPDFQTDPHPKLFLSSEEEEKGHLIFEKNKIDENRKTIMLGVLGSDPSKSLPIKYMAEVIDFIAANYPVNILFNYVPNQKPLIDNLMALVTHKDTIYPEVIGKCIREFIIIMNKTDCLIANEGGSVHIAKALDKPTFTIYSPYVKKEHWATFEDGHFHSSIHIEDVKPALINDADPKDLKKNSAYYYEQFSANLIISELKCFLNRHL